MNYTAVVVREHPMTLVLVGPDGMSLGGISGDQSAERLARNHLHHRGVEQWDTATIAFERRPLTIGDVIAPLST